MTTSPHDETGPGLLASITGKAKQIAGAVTGNDSLAREGVLQEAESRARKDAVVERAIAEERAEQAATTLSEQHRAAERAEQAVEAGGNARIAQAVEQSAEERDRAAAQVEQQRRDQQAAVERQTARALQQEQARTEHRLQELTAEQQDAAAEAADALRSADQADRTAARVRAENDRLAGEAGLPTDRSSS